MSKIVWDGGTLLAPTAPVMVTCGTMEESNIITVAWCGITNSNPPKTYISLRPERFSHEIIEKEREFVINLTTSQLTAAADYIGVHTGRKVDKFAKTGLTREKSSKLRCPLIAESPVCLECKVTDIIHLGSHDMFLADIVCTDVDEKFLDEKGKLHIEKTHLAAYCHGDYFEIGKRIGPIGFSVKKSRPPKSKR